MLGSHTSRASRAKADDKGAWKGFYSYTPTIIMFVSSDKWWYGSKVRQVRRLSIFMSGVRGRKLLAVSRADWCQRCWPLTPDLRWPYVCNGTWSMCSSITFLPAFPSGNLPVHSSITCMYESQSHHLKNIGVYQYHRLPPDGKFCCFFWKPQITSLFPNVYMFFSIKSYLQTQESYDPNKYDK